MVEACEGWEALLALRRVSPSAGSNESGLGVVVLLTGFSPEAAPSLEIAVIQERRSRVAWRREESLSRAIWLTWISSMSVRLSKLSVDAVNSPT